MRSTVQVCLKARSAARAGRLAGLDAFEGAGSPFNLEPLP